MLCAFITVRLFIVSKLLHLRISSSKTELFIVDSENKHWKLTNVVNAEGYL